MITDVAFCTLRDWNGLIHWFIQQVKADKKQLENSYIKTWFNAALDCAGDISRFTGTVAFIDDPAVEIKGANKLDINDPDYAIKLALLAGATVNVKGVKKTLKDFDLS